MNRDMVRRPGIDHAPNLKRTLYIGAVSIVVGGLLSGAFGFGFKAKPPLILKEDGITTGIGEIELIRMPFGGRSRNEIFSFELEGGGGDDYGRVFLNNMLVANGEHGDLFYTATSGDEAAARRKYYDTLTVDRNEYLVSRRDVKVLLRDGWNYIVAENENSTEGACQSRISISVNGSLLEGFPKFFPDNFSVDDAMSSPELAARFRKAGYNSEYNELSLAVSDNALCSRRIFAFYLR